MSVPLYQAKAEFFKTLGHPLRIRVLELLTEQERSVSELLEFVDVEPACLAERAECLAPIGEELLEKGLKKEVQASVARCLRTPPSGA